MLWCVDHTKKEPLSKEWLAKCLDTNVLVLSPQLTEESIIQECVGTEPILPESLPLRWKGGEFLYKSVAVPMNAIYYIAVFYVRIYLFL